MSFPPSKSLLGFLIECTGPGINCDTDKYILESFAYVTMSLLDAAWF